jgi:hypothetical protein
MKKPDRLNIYWHITGPDSAERIMKEGINADEEGYIYLLTELEIPEDVYGKKFSIPDIVVTSQIGYMNYIIIEIDPKGITARLQKDNVAEITAYAQRRVKQKKIEPKFLKIGKIQQVDVKQVRLFNTLLIEKLMSITSK